MVPVGRGNASELKYPADTLYDQVSFRMRATDTLAPNSPPTPCPTVDPVSRLKNPPLNDTSMLGSSRGDLVMMLTTPVSAFAPQTAEAGPRITSICLMSLMEFGRKSQRTMPKKSR